jgi:hypothetical protein
MQDLATVGTNLFYADNTLKLIEDWLIAKDIRVLG